MTPNRFHSIALALVAIIIPASSLLGQDRVKSVDEGDGRIHGAAVMPVSGTDLHPGQVQTINLHPRYHTVLEFPYPVARIDAGDPDVFSASIDGNDVTLKATKVTRAETSMSLKLADANGTVIPFLIRADSTQPYVYVIRYTDPVAKHLNQAEAQISTTLQADDDKRVSQLANIRLQQILLHAGDLASIDRTESVGDAGERLTVNILSAQTLPGEDGQPRLYLRYSVLNQTVAPLSDLVFTAHIVSTDRKMLVFQKSVAQDVYDIQDVRTTATIPAGTMAYGLLIFDDLNLANQNESLTIDANAFNNQRHLTFNRVLVGPAH